MGVDLSSGVNVVSDPALFRCHILNRTVLEKTFQTKANLLRFLRRHIPSSLGKMMKTAFQEKRV